MIDPATTAANGGAHALADRLVATLDDRPFAPTARQLATIGGGELVPGAEPGPLAHVVADRYAGLVASHLVQDVRANGASEAYARIWLCARAAFLQSLDPDGATGPEAPGLPTWENEGGAVAAPRATDGPPPGLPIDRGVALAR